MHDELVSSYVAIDIGQGVAVCVRRKYQISVQIHITDRFDTPKQQYTDLKVDDVIVASTPASALQGPPIVWHNLKGQFTAKSATAALKVGFVATDYLAAK